MNTVNIKSIQQKDSDGNLSGSIPIGTDPYLIGPLRNTNANNLEEQLLIGFESITESWTQTIGNVKYDWTETKFWNGIATDNTTEYYKLITKSFIKQQEIVDLIQSGDTDDYIAECKSIKEDEGKTTDILTAETIEALTDQYTLVSSNSAYVYTDYDKVNQCYILCIDPPELITEKIWLVYHVAGKGERLLLKKEKVSRLITCDIPNPSLQSGENTGELKTQANVLRTIERVTKNYLDDTDMDDIYVPYGSNGDSSKTIAENVNATIVYSIKTEDMGKGSIIEPTDDDINNSSITYRGYNTSAITVDYKGKINTLYWLPKITSSNGWVFDGWYDSNDSKISDNIVIKDGASYTAKFSAISNNSSDNTEAN